MSTGTQADVVSIDCAHIINPCPDTRHWQDLRRDLADDGSLSSEPCTSANVWEHQRSQNVTAVVYEDIVAAAAIAKILPTRKNSVVSVLHLAL